MVQFIEIKEDIKKIGLLSSNIESKKELPSIILELNLQNGKTHHEMIIDKMQTDEGISNDFNHRMRNVNGEASLEEIKINDIKEDKEYEFNAENMIKEYEKSKKLYLTSKLSEKDKHQCIIDEQEYKDSSILKLKETRYNNKKKKIMIKPAFTPPYTPSSPIISRFTKFVAPITPFVMPKSRPTTPIKSNDKIGKIGSEIPQSNDIDNDLVSDIGDIETILVDYKDNDNLSNLIRAINDTKQENSKDLFADKVKIYGIKKITKSTTPGSLITLIINSFKVAIEKNQKDEKEKEQKVEKIAIENKQKNKK